MSNAANRGTSVRYQPDERPPAALAFGCGLQLKALALVLAIPGPVAGAYLTVVMALTFVRGMTEIVQGGIDPRKGLIAGVAFWVGAGCQNGMIFPRVSRGGCGRLATERHNGRRSGGWGAKMVHRLEAAGEETLLALTGRDEREEKRRRRRLFLSAQREGGGAVLEFVAAVGEDNVQDRIALLGERPDDVLMEREVSLRLLRHIASSVRHQQFHETDIVTVRVAAPETGRADE